VMPASERSSTFQRRRLPSATLREGRRPSSAKQCRRTAGGDHLKGHHFPNMRTISIETPTQPRSRWDAIASNTDSRFLVGFHG
jgi:hypothetical protein